MCGFVRRCGATSPDRRLRLQIDGSVSGSAAISPDGRLVSGCGTTSRDMGLLLQICGSVSGFAASLEM
jgi:hypothetical protein